MSAQSHASIGRRVKHEFTQYLIISVYLYICLGAIIFYKWSVLHSQGIAYDVFGLAAIKALIMAKFMLVGHAVRIGERTGRSALIYPTLYRSLLFTLMLLVLNAAEAVIRGLLHGQTVVASLAVLAGGTWFELLASCLLMWLILVPYFAVRTLDEHLGRGTLQRIFLTGA